MEFDIDGLLQTTHPWDFTVRLGGVVYATRRPMVGELGAFAKASALDNPALMRLIGSLFTGDAPDPSTWSAQQLTAFLSGYLAYFNSRVDSEKKLEAIAAAAGKAVAAVVSGAAVETLRKD